MTYELFVIDQKEKLDEEELARVAHLRAKLSSAQNLGLAVQAVSISADIATIERGKLITTPPMTDNELVIWNAWLPTIYSDVTEVEQHQLANYDFDSIPSPVLRLWEKHKESGLFERFEVWTPRIIQPDPILVGVNGNARHLLARWGESDANLVSFEDIKRELVRRWKKDDSEDLIFHGAFGAVLLSMVFAVVIGLGLSFSGVSTNTALLIAAATGSALGVCTSLYFCWNSRRRSLQESELMQAIAKDDSRPREMLTA